MRKTLLLLTLSLTAASAAGCNVIGVAANALPASNTPARYQDMQNQSVAVMIWADRNTRFDWSTLQADAASRIHQRLRDSKARDLNGTTYPVEPRAIVEYQRRYPQVVENRPITEIAHVFGVSRLIYIEVEQFQTRSDVALELYRGTMAGTIKVIAVENGQGSIVYEEPDVRVHFPRSGPQEGTIHANDELIYHGTLNEFAEAVARRFMAHRAE